MDNPIALLDSLRREHAGNCASRLPDKMGLGCVVGCDCNATSDNATIDRLRTLLAGDGLPVLAKSARDQAPAGQSDDQILAEAVAGSAMLVEAMQRIVGERDAALQRAAEAERERAKYEAWWMETQREQADAEQRATAADARADALAEALTRALPLLETAAEEQQSYGYFLGGFVDGDPRKFSPDEECATPAEIAQHKADCEAWDRGEHPRHRVMTAIDPERSIARQLKGSDSAMLERDAEGNVIGGHVHRAGYGLGVTVFRDAEAVALHAGAVAALAAHRARGS